MKAGAYYKQIGGFGAVVWTGRQWARAECYICAQRLGVARTRIDGPPPKKAMLAFLLPYAYRHDPDLHRSPVLSQAPWAIPPALVSDGGCESRHGADSGARREPETERKVCTEQS